MERLVSWRCRAGRPFRDVVVATEVTAAPLTPPLGNGHEILTVTAFGSRRCWWSHSQSLWLRLNAKRVLRGRAPTNLCSS